MLVFPIVHLFSIFASIKKKDQKALLVFVLCFNVDCKKSFLLASIAEEELILLCTYCHFSGLDLPQMVPIFYFYLHATGSLCPVSTHKLWLCKP